MEDKRKECTRGNSTCSVETVAINGDREREMEGERVRGGGEVGRERRREITKIV
jgi:hypothetical protein